MACISGYRSVSAAMTLWPILILGFTVSVRSSHPFHEDRVLLLPNNQKCSPIKGSCNKGDLLDPDVADCELHRNHNSILVPLTCSAKNSGGIISWVIGPDKNDFCKPKRKGVKFLCGSSGTNTRCVCSDYKLQLNTCRCQYWTETTPGQDELGFCTAQYLGGNTHVHHYACCNNCIKGRSTCNNVTYEGGSSGSYCGKCGQPLGGGQLKWYFNCVNCSVQESCRKKCDKVVSTIPGLCWKWVNCFKGCCTKMSQHSHHIHHNDDRETELALDVTHQKEEDEGFCGDLSCQLMETTSSCPSDCCPVANNITCNASKCSPLCCLKDDCCLV